MSVSTKPDIGPILSKIEDETVRKALERDQDLLVCKACGIQCHTDDTKQLRTPDQCPICEDDRQAVPPTGQAWTSVGRWISDTEKPASSEIRIDADAEDDRIMRIIFKNAAAGIGGQTPIVIVTEHGVVIWDPCATCTPDVFAQIKALAKRYHVSLLAIALSHPHFYATALTWAQALDTPVYASSVDRGWWMRKIDDQVANKYLNLYDTPQHQLAPGLTLVRCGGHFDGSAVLHWDRAKAVGPKSFTYKRTPPTTAVVFPSDTFMAAADKQTVSFMWSYPNSIPLPPRSVEAIWHAMRPYEFDDIIGSWPGQYVKREARRKLLFSAERFVRFEGHDPASFDWGDK